MDIPLLLTPVSADSPCGDDLEYDAAYLLLEQAAQGQPERSMGDAILPAEPPQWRDVRQQSLALLQRSKDLRIANRLLQASLALDGLPALSAALEVIHQWLTIWWDDVHPKLDADDDNDPTLRLNALLNLTGEDTLRLLRDVSLARSRAFGNVTLRAAANACGLQHVPSETLTSEQFNAALQDCEPELLQANVAALSSALQSLDAIEREVGQRLGIAQGVDLGALRQLIRLGVQILGDCQGAAPAEGEPAVAAEASLDQPVAAAPAARRNEAEINDRQDVLKTLDRLLAYYGRHEPSSPLPVLLRRARQLVDADFETIVRNLIPDGFSQYENLRGPEPE